MFSKIENSIAERERESEREVVKKREMTRAIKILALLFLVVPFVMQMRPADENRQRRDIFLYEAARFLCVHRRKYMCMYSSL